MGKTYQNAVDMHRSIVIGISCSITLGIRRPRLGRNLRSNRLIRLCRIVRFGNIFYFCIKICECILNYSDVFMDKLFGAIFGAL